MRAAARVVDDEPVLGGRLDGEDTTACEPQLLAFAGAMFGLVIAALAVLGRPAEAWPVYRRSLAGGAA